VAYTLSRSHGNTTGVFPVAGNMGVSPFQYLDDMRLDANEGPTDVDRRHNFVLSGSAVVPRTGGLTVAAVVRALSGLPFTVQNTEVDADRNGVLFDPLPAGTYSGTGLNAFTVDKQRRPQRRAWSRLLPGRRAPRIPDPVRGGATRGRVRRGLQPDEQGQLRRGRHQR
jgi:hypothetical protein